MSPSRQIEKDRISVIMGVYNGGKHLKAAINSIIAQTYNNWEFVICDDASNDDTWEILKQYESDKRFVLFRHDKNMGLPCTLNHCINKANGEFIARMDGDDISYPERFEKQLDFLHHNKEFAFVSTSIEIYDGIKVVRRVKMKEFPDKYDFLWNSPFIHAATMFRREALEDINGYRVSEETRRGQDYDLFMRLYANNSRGANLLNVLYRYIVTPQTYSRRTMKARFGEYKIRKKGFKSLGLMPIGLPFLFKPFLAQLYQYFHTTFLPRIVGKS